MKKILLSAVAVIALSMTSQAQEVEFGAKAGLNIADLGSDAETSGSRTGFHFGGVAEIKFSEKFSVQPELLYSMQGAKSDITGNEVETKLDYINLPIMAKYYVMEGLSVEAGPQVGFLMSAITDGNDVKDNTKGIDFGFNIGAGYELSNKIFFQARYNLGL